jgi:hypothetical protein
MDETAMNAGQGMWLTVISFVAGTLVALSSLPQVIAGLRHPPPRCGPLQRGRRLRNFAQAAGNMLWIVFGFGAGAAAIVIFCSVNVALIIVLIYVEHSDPGET